MEIRFAQPEDVPAILRLLGQVGCVHAEGRPDIFRPNAQKYSASQVLGMLGKSETPIFIAAEGETVLGYGFCQVQKIEKDPVFSDRTELYLDDLCVEETCRGQGVGQAIYQAVRKYAKNRGCRSVTLNVWHFKGSALAFYEKLGLKPRNTHLEDALEDV